ncbi:hypothetical protein [Actinacidiphila glaucinigra]|uniref:Uncharacterized protein n=1 Tax=Actinacidiphila glaucinigra TaxID=235986 RepID=A0A239JG34_9ACTN|nr:hypothetical protein [Actinacidiphila glaucinigra]SNT04562.1 hypothetical protein SAMN05216252_1136 [Actinacidiphila glaucinigra]
MTRRPTVEDRTDPAGVEESAIGDIARLVEAVALSTAESPDSILAHMSDDIVAGLFAFLRAHHDDETCRRVARQPGAL